LLPLPDLLLFAKNLLVAANASIVPHEGRG